MVIDVGLIFAAFHLVLAVHLNALDIAVVGYLNYVAVSIVFVPPCGLTAHKYLCYIAVNVIHILIGLEVTRPDLASPLMNSIKIIEADFHVEHHKVVELVPSISISAITIKLPYYHHIDILDDFLVDTGVIKIEILHLGEFPAHRIIREVVRSE